MRLGTAPIFFILALSCVLAFSGARADTNTAFTVTVTGPGGKPLEGAHVYLFATDGPSFSSGATGTDGIVRFRELARSPACLLVTAPHHTPVAREVSPGMADTVVTMPAARDLRLRILDNRTAEPVPEADVVLFSDFEACGAQPWVGITASRRVHVELDPESRDDTVEVRDVPAERGGAFVVAPGHGLALVRLGSADPVEITLDSSTCVPVRVVEEGTQRPVEGVRIVPERMLAILPTEGEASRGARKMLAAFGSLGTTDAEGHTVVCPPPGGSARLAAVSDDRLPTVFDVPGESRAEVVVRLPATATLQVRVLDESTGEPLPGVHVALEGDDFTDRLVTGADGIAVENGIPARRPVRVRAVTPDETGDLAVAEIPPLAPASRETVDLYLSPSLRLLLEDGDGRRLPTVPVLLLEPGRNGTASSVIAAGLTGEDGIVTFYLPGPPPGGTLVAVRREADLVVRDLPPPTDDEDPLAPRPVVLGGTEVSLRILAEGTEDPVVGAVIRCRLASGQPAPARLDLRRGTGPLQLGRAPVRYIPGDPGLLALAGTGGRTSLLVPASCDGLVVEGPVDERVRYGTVSLLLEDLEEAATATLDVLLPRETGITVRPSFSGQVPERLSFRVRPLDGDGPERVIGGPPTSREIPLPADAPSLVVLRAAGYAPALLGPVVGDETWPGIDAMLEIGGFVRVALPTGAGEGGAVLVDDAGIDWWDFTDHSLLTSDDETILEIGPLPLGRWHLEIAGGRCTAEIRVRAPGERSAVRCE